MNEQIGIIGPQRTKTGIGEYIAKYISIFGAQVTAIVSSTLEKGRYSADILSKKYGINVSVYNSVEQMFNDKSLDAVAICSPAQTHEEYLFAALEADVHVFCEKPLVWDDREDNVETTKKIIQSFMRSKSILHCNMQWPYTLTAFEQLHGFLDKTSISTFHMELSPALSNFSTMISESAPHANSMLLALGAHGSISDLYLDYDMDSPDSPGIRIKFTIRGFNNQDIQATYEFIQVINSPRPACYSINGKIARRKLSPDYKFFFGSGNGREIELEDPLALSIKDFLFKLRQSEFHKDTIQYSNIITNMEMLSQLYEGFYESTKN